MKFFWIVARMLARARRMNCETTIGAHRHRRKKRLFPGEKRHSIEDSSHAEKHRMMFVMLRKCFATTSIDPLHGAVMNQMNDRSRRVVDNRRKNGLAIFSSTDVCHSQPDPRSASRYRGAFVYRCGNSFSDLLRARRSATQFLCVARACMRDAAGALYSPSQAAATRTRGRPRCARRRKRLRFGSARRSAAASPASRRIEGSLASRRRNGRRRGPKSGPAPAHRPAPARAAPAGAGTRAAAAKPDRIADACGSARAPRRPGRSSTPA